MDGLVRLWSMTALEAARRSEQTRSNQAVAQLPASLGKAGASAWSRWMARRETTGDAVRLTNPGSVSA
jgi:hypothetical protein